MHLQSLPQELLSSLEGIKGFHRETFEQVHRSGEQVVSIRINPAKALSPHSIAENFSSGIAGDQIIRTEKIPWSSVGYYLSARPSFTLDPLFHAGLYYVQEASSMFLEQALRQTCDLSSSLKILDLCAAPGGKSTLIQSLISDKSLLVSNEVIKSRVSILQENLIKWGASNVIITNNDPKDFSRLANYFDVIVVDAPCSGSGLFRRDEDAIEEWSEDNVKLCTMRQQRIIADIWPALKKNGIIIYCTCSYSKEENEDNVDWIMEEFNAKSIQLNLTDGIVDGNDISTRIVEVESDSNHGYGYRFYPDRVKGEGFFIACFQKNDGNDFEYPRSKKTATEKLTKQEEVSVKKYFKADESLHFFKYNDVAYALPSHLINDFNLIREMLYLRKAGIAAGKFAGDELIPDHELALSFDISNDIPSVELSREDAIEYLRKEEIKIETPMRGWAIAQYKNQNLGWMKLLQNRINNYYPKEWRIRMRG